MTDTFLFKKYKLENEISEIIRADNNCSCHFEWDYSRQWCDISQQLKPHAKLSLITYNPSHKGFFLLHSVIKCLINSDYRTDYSLLQMENGDIIISVLNDMLEYVKSSIKRDLNYTIQWNYRNFSERENKTEQQPDRLRRGINLHDNAISKTSYFSGKSVEEVLQKLYFGKKKDEIIIYSIQMISES